ncbi:uncharacterized protein LOC133839540 [Drosophila sulfurigaster albostrigata]|uniref:uncharacterized protein LOC133839540 n=1 Tax=Drosophila sulfurigaster albostrigata TaxID=89887 RepID=UPI002D21D5BB|nr:uncharacterized protein LOC133839540 [Drosophila sulfurigaster albostrigata]
MKLVIFLCLLSLSLSANTYMNIAQCSDLDCPDTIETVWAMTKYCTAFRNKCYFDMANCFSGFLFGRQFRAVSYEECKEHCNTNCLRLDYKRTVDNYTIDLQKSCIDILIGCKTGQITW